MALTKIRNKISKDLSARRLKWLTGRPVFAASARLRQRYAIATEAIDIVAAADVASHAVRESRFELTGSVLDYFNRFGDQAGCPIQGSTLVLPHQLYVFRLRGVSQLGHTGAILQNSSGKLVDASLLIRGFRSPNLDLQNYFRPRNFRDVQQIKGPAISMIGRWKSHRHFAHFILERLRLLLMTLEDLPLNKATVVIRDEVPAFQRAAFDEIGRQHPQLEFIEVGAGTRLEFEELLVPIETANHALVWYARRGAMEAVRDLYLGAYGLAPATGDNNRKLYLSRNRQKLRRLLNEADLTPLLVERGYDIVHPEMLAHRGQVLLMQEATSIFAPSGSAIAGTLFCAPRTKILLTGPLDVHKPFWVGLALALGHQFAFLPGSNAQAHYNFTVDKDRLALSL
jgi:hypothetical protein